MTDQLTTAQRFLVQAHGGRTLRDILAEAREEHRTIQATAKALGITQITLRLWLKQVGLPTANLPRRRETVA